MRKILKRKLPFLLVLAMIAGLLPVWTVPVKAAAETTISEDTTYNATYHISDDTTLYIAKGVTYSADSFCFDGNYTLTVRGAGTLETGDITTTSSAVIYSLAIESGRFTAQNINCGYGSKIFINGGSVKMNNIFPYAPLSLSDGSPVYSAIITVAGLHAITDVTYSVDGGSTIESSTDENGKLYLWLTNGSHIITVSDGTINYSAWISTEKNSWSNATASPIAAAENSINDRSVAITEPGNYVITGSGGTSNTIMVNGGVGSAENPVNITLSNVNIDVSPAEGCAFLIGTSSYVNLTLRGSNTLKSGGYYAGLNVPEGATLTIDEDAGTAAEDSLAAAGEDGAGIGANRMDGIYGGNGGTVIIHGGIITAESTDGAGIGGAAGYRGS